MRLLRVHESRYIQAEMVEEVHTAILENNKTMLTFYMFSGRKIEVKVRTEDAAKFIEEYKMEMELRP